MPSSDSSDREVFESYLTNYFSHTGRSVLPQQKVAALEELLNRTMNEGMVPISADHTMTLPVNDPAVQAVLRGEAVQVGGGKEVGGRKKGALAGLTRQQQIGVMVGLVFGVVIVSVGAFVLLSNSTASQSASARSTQTALALAQTPSSTLTLTPTSPFLIDVSGAGPTVDKTLAALFQGTNAGEYWATLYPGGVPPYEQGQVVVLPETRPSDDPLDPVSLEIGQTSFILGKGEVNKGGWAAKGAEWLAGTEIRRVVAIPRDKVNLQNVPVGMTLRLRWRNAAIVEYQVSGHQRVARSQIEFITEVYPSLVIILYDPDPAAGSTRDIIFAEGVTGVQRGGIYPTPTPTPTPRGGWMMVISNINGYVYLREKPCGKGIVKLENGTWVEVLQNHEPQWACDTHWVYVRIEDGTKGWVQWNSVATPTPIVEP